MHEIVLFNGYLTKQKCPIQKKERQAGHGCVLKKFIKYAAFYVLRYGEYHKQGYDTQVGLWKNEEVAKTDKAVDNNSKEAVKEVGGEADGRNDRRRTDQTDNGIHEEAEQSANARIGEMGDRAAGGDRVGRVRKDTRGTRGSQENTGGTKLLGHTQKGDEHLAYINSLPLTVQVGEPRRVALEKQGKDTSLNGITEEERTKAQEQLATHGQLLMDWAKQNGISKDHTTDGRRSLRKKIVNEYYNKGSYAKGKQAFLILGLPAAGKSSLADPLAKKMDATIVEPKPVEGTDYLSKRIDSGEKAANNEDTKGANSDDTSGTESGRTIEGSGSETSGERSTEAKRGTGQEHLVSGERAAILRAGEDQDDGSVRDRDTDDLRSGEETAGERVSERGHHVSQRDDAGGTGVSSARRAVGGGNDATSKSTRHADGSTESVGRSGDTDERTGSEQSDEPTERVETEQRPKPETIRRGRFYATQAG